MGASRRTSRRALLVRDPASRTRESRDPSRSHLLPVRQALLGALHLLFLRAGLLLDQVVLQAAARLGGGEDLGPRGRALAEEHRVLLAGRPVLAVHALDAPRVRSDPR